MPQKCATFLASLYGAITCIASSCWCWQPTNSWLSALACGQGLALGPGQLWSQCQQSTARRVGPLVVGSWGALAPRSLATRGQQPLVPHSAVPMGGCKPRYLKCWVAGNQPEPMLFGYPRAEEIRIGERLPNPRIPVPQDILKPTSTAGLSLDWADNQLLVKPSTSSPGSLTDQGLSGQSPTMS